MQCIDSVEVKIGTNSESLMFKNKTLLITGGTGSFGNAVLARLLEYDFSEIRVFSRDEKKQEDMRLAMRNDKVKFYIGDVRQYDSVHDAMRKVDFVFHAAALKQVPSCEFYPMEAFRTNVLGAENVVRAAIACEVQRCVVLSTDKAVYPINAMGISKAMMEKVMVAQSRLCDPATNGARRDAIRKCDGFARIGHSAVSSTVAGRKAAYVDGSEHDALSDVAGGFC